MDVRVGLSGSWVLKNWCFWTVVLEKTLESPLDCKEIQSVNPKRNQSWIFIGRTDDEVETPVLWPPDAKNRLIGKDPDAGKHWRQQEKGMTEDEMIEWHHWHDGWVWVGSESWWWTEKPGVLQSKGVARSWTELNWTEGPGVVRQSLLYSFCKFCICSVSHICLTLTWKSWYVLTFVPQWKWKQRVLMVCYTSISFILFHIVQKTKRTKNQPQSQKAEIVESTKCNTVESTKS